MTCSMEHRLETQLKDEREAFDAMREALVAVREDGMKNHTGAYHDFKNCHWCKASAALAKANAVRPKGNTP